MKIEKGIAVSSNVAIAKAVVLYEADYRIPNRRIMSEAVAGEKERFAKAVQGALSELEGTRDEATKHYGRETAAIFDWHIGVVRDQRLAKQVTEYIEHNLSSAPYALTTVMRKYQRRFKQMEDPLLADRIRDVRDIERRLLRNLLGESREDLSALEEDVILVAHDLSPSQSAELSGTKVVGVALDLGGLTSHLAIVLRTLGRPAVIGLGDISTRVNTGDVVVVDGTHGLVVINPDPESLEKYQEDLRIGEQTRVELSELSSLPAVTKDGERVELLANIEFPEEARHAAELGADGIGLYRTEYLYLGSIREPSEEDQFEAYRAAIKPMGDRPVTIRSIDLGADKRIQDRIDEPERNPMMGLRSLRYCLQHLHTFKVQLRAILRVSALGNVQIMFPLVIGLMEFRQAKMTLHDAMEDLDEENIPFDRNIRVGIMVETPAAALMCKEFAREVDFISIGTNDLVQYTLAVDRGNERVGHLYTAAHPAVMRTVSQVIKTANKSDLDCSLCGEMAGEPMYTLLLLGMGLRKFSMAPGDIPEIKKLIRLTTINNAQRIARKALRLETDRQVSSYLCDETRKLLPNF